MDHTLLFNMIEWSGVVLGIAGAVLVAYRIVWGFHLWIIANACIISLAMHDGRWGVVLLFVVYTVTSGLGIWKWERKDKN